ncbi:MAG: hypothetical protein ABI766_05880 [Gemmatimonadales bacterium]
MCSSSAWPRPPQLIVLTLLAVLACSGERSPRTAGAARSLSGSVDAPSVATQPADPDPCSFLSQTEAEAILGPLKRTPERVKNDESVEPDPRGRVCSYHPVDRAGRKDENVRVEVAVHDGLEFEVSTRAALGATRDWVSGKAPGDTLLAGPWDAAARAGTHLFTARQGDAAVQVSVRWLGVKDGKVDSIAARVLANIPDRPAAAPVRHGDEDTSSSSDPCGVLTEGEVQAVLGKLNFPPYRSRTNTSMVEASGASCSYRTSRHRVLVLSPEPDGGATTFKLAGLTSGLIGTRLEQGQEADTLDDGPWDHSASDMNGALLFLKGDALLQMQYRTSSTNLAGAVKLARLAMGRM